MLVLIGMLHHRRNPNTVIKSYAFAAVAKAEGAQLVFFSPKAVDFKNNYINGYVYNNGSWQKMLCPFPDVVYNAGSPEKLSRSEKIVSKLKKRIPFTTHSIGNKMRVYERLMEAGEFAQYLIPSEIVYTVSAFFNFFNVYKKIVFKPINGHKGQGVTFIEKKNNGYELTIGKETTFYSFDELHRYISDRISRETYLVQPYINCRTKAGNAYDFRLHVQKNGEGKWVIAAIYPRIASKGCIVSNLNSGGSTKFLNMFLKEEFGRDYYDIYKYLECFALQLAVHMDEIQRNKFSETIDELGIDVGLDESRKLWLYEVNWRPGPPISYYLELDSVRNIMRHAMFLAGMGKGVLSHRPDYRLAAAEGLLERRIMV